MKFKGIVLGHPGHPAFAAERDHFYRFKQGRAIALTRGERLPREWMRAYVQWHQVRGETEKAATLRRNWLAAPKAVRA